MYTHVHSTHNADNHCTQMYANLLWRERGSNPRRADYDSTVLPTELSRQRIVQCIMHKHIVSLYLRTFVCALNPLHQITKMHNDIYIWSLWYVCTYVCLCIASIAPNGCSAQTKCVQFAFNLHLICMYTYCTHSTFVCTSTSVGVKGFEPLHLGTKNRRLSTWLYSIQYVCLCIAPICT